MTTTLRGFQMDSLQDNVHYPEDTDYRDILASGANIARTLVYPQKLAGTEALRVTYRGSGMALSDLLERHRRGDIRQSVLRGADDNLSYSLSDYVLEAMDQMVERLAGNGITVIFCFQLPYEDIGSKDGELWTNAKLQASLADLWKSVAQRYDGKNVWFDLINEPVFWGDAVPQRESPYVDVMQPICDAIRSVSWNRIVYQSSPGGMAHTFNYAPPKTPNLIGSVHFYWPYQLTHNGVNDAYPWNPAWKYPMDGTPPDPMVLNADVLCAGDGKGGGLDIAGQWSEKYQTPILVGEFSCIRWDVGDSRIDFQNDCIDLFENKYKWLGWIWCAWRSWPGWDAECEDQTPPDDPSFSVSVPERNAYSKPMVVFRRSIPPR